MQNEFKPKYAKLVKGEGKKANYTFLDKAYNNRQTVQVQSLVLNNEIRILAL